MPFRFLRYSKTEYTIIPGSSVTERRWTIGRSTLWICSIVGTQNSQRDLILSLRSAYERVGFGKTMASPEDGKITVRVWLPGCLGNEL